MLDRRRFVSASLAGLAMPFVGRGAAARIGAQPIRIVVPFAPGGGVDTFARLIAERLRVAHGFTIIVDNRPGANGTIGGMVVRDAARDGHTLLFSAGTHVMAQQVMRAAPYDPLGDFSPIARVGEAPMLLISAARTPQTTVAEVIADAKRNPQRWTFATAALGAPGHLATVAFIHLAGLDLTVIPYRGTAPALNDVMGGHVQLMIDPVIALLPPAVAGTVRGLGVTGAKRTRIAPQFPTVAEAGVPGMDYATWYGVWGPKALDAGLVRDLNALMTAAAADLDREGRLERVGLEPIAETPADFDQFGRRWVATNARLLETARFERE